MSATKVQHDTWVSIHGERGDEWEQVTGTRIFPVKSFLSVPANLPGLGEQQVYLLALDVVPSEMKGKIVAHLCQKFGLSEEESAREIEAGGIPILAADCTVSSTGMWFL